MTFNDDYIYLEILFDSYFFESLIKKASQLVLLAGLFRGRCLE